MAASFVLLFFFVPGYSLMKTQRRASHLEFTLTIDIDHGKSNYILLIQGTYDGDDYDF